MTQEKLIVYGSLAGIPITIATYLSALDSVRSYLNTGHLLTVWLGAFAVAAITIALGANAVIHWRGFHRPVDARSSDASAGSAAAQEYLNVEEFYRTYDNTFLQEIEAEVRALSNRYAPGPDRERFLVRAASTIFAIAVFENTWALIGNSQLRALLKLNTTPLSLDELHRFYDEGGASRPDHYEQTGLTFDRWLGYGRELRFIEDADSRIQITARGKEFLKYLTHKGYDVNAPRLG